MPIFAATTNINLQNFSIMKTSKEYKENLANGIVTASMLEDVLYSYNKRAKNYRDKANIYRQRRRENRYWRDLYDNEGQCEEKKDILYGKKSDILLHCPEYLSAIHKVSRKHRTRIYETDEEYEDYTDDIIAYRKGKESVVINENEYFDYSNKEYVSFIDINKTVNEYYLYYEFPNRSFHSPLGDDEDEKIDLSMYKGLNIVEIDSLTTYGKKINNMLSLQFCDKVWNYLITNK